MLFGVYTLFLIKQKSKNITADWYISIDQAFSTTDLAGIAKSVLHPLMFTLAEGKSELGASLISPWDSKYFIKKPIFNLMNDIVFPVSLPLLENAFADGLYWKIRNIYPRDEVKFQNFFGKPFELYIQDLLADSCLRSPLPYEVIFEFPYGKPEVMSPDVMVRFKNQLLAIEGKAQRIVYDKSVVEGNEESIEKDRIKMTVKPMEQLYSRVKELLEVPNDNCNLNGVDEVFLIVVNQGAFPTLPPIERRIEEDWAGLKGIKVPVNFYHMSIEEIEIICSLMERKKPIFRILRHKLHYPNNPFVNFISEQSVNIRNPQLLQKESDKLINWFSNHLL